MRRITISEAQKSTSPNSLSLICVNTLEGITNLTTISWWTFLSNKPPMIGFSISQKSYTGELIKNTKKAILSIPGEAIAEQVLKCGRISGREVNKADKFGIALTGTDIKYPINSKLVFICTLKKTVDAGDHIFYICYVEDILYNNAEKQLYAWDGYSRISPINNNSIDTDNCTMEQAFRAFTQKAFGGVNDRYVYDGVTQNSYITKLLLNEKKELLLHFTYLPRIIGLKSLANNKKVTYQRGLLTFVMKDGMCHVTSKLEVSSQGVPTEYKGFAVITNPLSSGPSCTCFLREIDNAFGIFILFSFRLSSLENIHKRKTRISECMAVRKDDGTSYVYRLLISENFIEDKQMKYFAGHLKIGTDENTGSGSELNIYIRESFIDTAEKFFTNPSSIKKDRALYSDLSNHFRGENKSDFIELIKKVRAANSASGSLLTVKPTLFDKYDKNSLLFLGWLGKHSLAARHDKVEMVLDNEVEKIHKILYPNLHSIKPKVTNRTLQKYCRKKQEIITFLAKELTAKNVVKYNQKAQIRLSDWGLKCKACEVKQSNCIILHYYSSSENEQRRILNE